MSLRADYLRYDGMGLTALVARGEVHPGELLDEALRRVEAVDHRLGAMASTMEEEARRQIARGEVTGPFGGTPFLLKDLRAQYAGTPTSAGSRFFAGAVPEYHTEVVRRHRRAGLVTFGKTKTPELGCNLATEPRYGGPARNPWNTALIPGGSSGGAAALVAARVAPLAHATDGGGSIRIPAACCGLFGLKPTRGRTPAGPDRGEGWGGLSTEHAVSLTVRDSALLLDVTAGPDPGAPYYPASPPGSFLSVVGADPGRLRIGFSLHTPRGHDLHPDHRRVTEETALLCEELGHIVEEASPSWDLNQAGSAYSTVVNANVARTVEDRARTLGRPPGPDDLEAGVRHRVEEGNRTGALAYLEALDAIHRVGRQVSGFFETHHAWLTPTVASPPPPLGTFNADSEDTAQFRSLIGRFSPFCSVANMTGQPAMSVPLGETLDRLPVGVHFLGRYGDEATLLMLAAQLEEARPWFGRRPALADV
ncbi:MAG: amidase [Acidimicrobiia bacterium]|nr:amidase [Acidimicrobiia bacterium]